MRSERANFVIRRKYVGGSANDVGFLRQPDSTFDMIVSEFETETGAYAGDHKNDKVAFLEWRYQFNVVQQYAYESSFPVVEVETPDGISLELEFSEGPAPMPPMTRRICNGFSPWRAGRNCGTG